MADPWRLYLAKPDRTCGCCCKYMYSRCTPEEPAAGLVVVRVASSVVQKFTLVQGKVGA